jgi:hypothetical protein
MLVQHANRCGCLEGDLAGEQLVGEHTEGVHIGGGREAGAEGLFRGDVGRRPDDDPRLGRALLGVVGATGDPEVREGDLPGRVVDGVPGLDVAVDHADGVGGVEGGGELGEQRQHIVLGHQLAGGRELVEALLQGWAGEQLLDHVGRALIFAKGEDLGDVGVAQPCDKARLAAKAALVLRVGGEGRGEHLYRYGALQLGVEAPVDGGHAPAAEKGFDDIGANLRSDERGVC